MIMTVTSTERLYRLEEKWRIAARAVVRAAERWQRCSESKSALVAAKKLDAAVLRLIAARKAAKAERAKLR